ncbi:MAG: rhomboid family intramembrane serine protease [Planctomycetota bacterium]
MTGADGTLPVRMGWNATPTVKWLVIINVAVYLLSLIIGAVSRPLQFRIFDMVSLYSDHPFTWELWRYVSYSFLHDPTNIWHLIGNMLGLFFLGPMAERPLGRSRFIMLFLGAAAVSGLCEALLAGKGGFIMGASGAVMAVTVAAAVIAPRAIVILFIVPMYLMHLAILFVAADVVMALVDMQGGRGGIARFAHLAGAAFGFLFVRAQPWPAALGVRFQARRRSRARARTAADSAEIDRLLAKIKAEGMPAITGRERRFLLDHSGDTGRAPGA